MGISPRRQLRQLFRQEELLTPPMMPQALAVSARVAGAEVRELWLDAELMATAMRRCQSLLGYSVIMPALTPGLELNPGAAETYAEAMRRLRATGRDAVALAGYVTGPRTLAHLLGGGTDRVADLLPHAEGLALNHTRRLCEAGVDLILVSEAEPVPLGADSSAGLGPVYAALWNTARYYNTWPVLALAGNDGLGWLEQDPDSAPAGVLLLQPGISTTDSRPQVRERLEGLVHLRERWGVAVGIGLCPAVFAAGPAAAGELRGVVQAMMGRRGWFFSTSSELPAEMPLENLQAALSAFSGGG